MTNPAYPNFMLIRSEADISRLIEEDAWRMDVLKAAEKLNLPDWWIGAGFLRNIVWDTIEGNASLPTRDVDLAYFDPVDIALDTDLDYDNQMKRDYPFAEWEVRNQARMHHVNNFEPFQSTADGIAHWPETATCVGVRLENRKLHYLFCYGTDDLFNLIARPAPIFQSANLISIFHDRTDKKQWQQKWPNLRIEES